LTQITNKGNRKKCKPRISDRKHKLSTCDYYQLQTVALLNHAYLGVDDKDFLVVDKMKDGERNDRRIKEQETKEAKRN
jgi:hypothetical protein